MVEAGPGVVVCTRTGKLFITIEKKCYYLGGGECFFFFFLKMKIILIYVLYHLCSRK